MTRRRGIGTGRCGSKDRRHLASSTQPQIAVGVGSRRTTTRPARGGPWAELTHLDARSSGRTFRSNGGTAPPTLRRASPTSARGPGSHNGDRRVTVVVATVNSHSARRCRRGGKKWGWRPVGRPGHNRAQRGRAAADGSPADGRATSAPDADRKRWRGWNVSHVFLPAGHRMPSPSLTGPLLQGVMWMWWCTRPAVQGVSGAARRSQGDERDQGLATEPPARPRQSQRARPLPAGPLF